MQQYLAQTNLGNVAVTDYTANNVCLRYNGGSWQVQDVYDYSIPERFREYINKSVEASTGKEIRGMAISKNKRGLFQVILIDPREKKMLLNTIVISDSVEDVLLEVDAGKIIKDAGLAVADVDKIVNILGQVRKTKKNKTGEVEIINEDDNDKS